MRLHTASHMVRSALTLVRTHPMAWAALVWWFAVLASLVMCGDAVLRGVRSSLGRVEESLGMHVVVAPDAAGLAALNQAIAALPGVRDARFVVQPLPLAGLADTAQLPRQRASLYVRTRSTNLESLQDLATAIGAFPQVDVVVSSPEMAERVSDARIALTHLTWIARGAGVLMVVFAGVFPGAWLVRSHRRSAIVAYALGASRWESAAPAGIAGAAGGGLGSLLAVVGVVIAGSAGSSTLHEALRHTGGHGGIVLLSGLVLGAVGPLTALHGALRGRPPAHLDAGTP